MNRTKIFTIVGAAALLAVVLAFYILVARRGTARPSSRAALTEAQKTYLAEIVVAGARMSAAESFAGSSVTYLDARLTNRGAKPVRGLEIQMEFQDTLGQVVLRETARPVNSHTRPLQAGETRDFQVSFDHMPADWNQAPPTITTTNVEF